MEYRKLHQDFISNHEGTNLFEILSLSLISQFSHLFFSFLPSPISNSVTEFIVLILPLLLSLTVLSDYHFLLSLVLLLFTSGLILIHRIKRHGVSCQCQQRTSECLSWHKLGFITNYRSSMLLVTSLCILAVDFPIFPRRFAKTEKFGYGFMDMGVGTFIFASGLVSHQSRFSKIDCNGIRQSVKNSLLLMTLGILRLLSVKALNYQEHVSEYGTHWNFFFTMAVSQISCSIISFLSSSMHSLMIGLGFGIAHEFILHSSFGASWLLNDSIERTDLISANREGLMSIPGYIAIYLFAVYFGNQIFKESRKSTERLSYLTIRAVVLWIIFFVCQRILPIASRRIVNFNYILLMVSFNITLLALFDGLNLIEHCCTFVSETEKKSRKKSKIKLTIISQNTFVPPLYEALSYNPNLYFLLANLLTGIINMTFSTIHIEGCPAVIILIVYLASLITITYFLFKKRIKIF